METLEEYEEAYDAFYKSTWSDGNARNWDINSIWRGFKSLRGQYREALEFARTALIRNWHDIKVRGFIAAMNRKLQIRDEAFLLESCRLDPLAMNLLYEEGAFKGDFSSWKLRRGKSSFNRLELALEYVACGLYDDALLILEEAEDQPDDLLCGGVCLHEERRKRKGVVLYTQGGSNEDGLLLPQSRGGNRNSRKRDRNGKKLRQRLLLSRKPILTPRLR